MTQRKCADCPLAGHETCLGVEHPDHFGHFCVWAASGDNLKRRAIVGRSERGFTPLPGLAKQTVNLVRSVANHVVTGLGYADETTKNARLAICGTCVEFDQGRCRQCGCFLTIKTGWASESCPIGKWGPIEPHETPVGP